MVQQIIAPVPFLYPIVTSFMNDALDRSAILDGQTTPGWGGVATDHLRYDGAERLIGKRHLNGGTTMVGFTFTYVRIANTLLGPVLQA